MSIPRLRAANYNNSFFFSLPKLSDMAASSLAALTLPPLPLRRRPPPFSSLSMLRTINPHLISNFPLASSISTPPAAAANRCSPKAPILSMLPTARPDRETSDEVPKWSARAIKSFGMAELEARKLKYPTTGTESLLMGILVEGTSFAAKFLRTNGITLFKVREEVVKMLGKSDMYYFSPEHPPLTEPAQKALDWAVDQKMNSDKSGEVTTTLLLLGVWYQKESAGHKIMETFGFDDEKAKELEKHVDEDAVLTYR